MDKGHIKTKIYVALGVFIALFLIASHFLRHTVSALLTSLAIAYLCNPLLKYLEKRGFSRALSIAFLYGILALGAFFASFVVIPYVGHQVEALTSSLPRYVQNIRGALDAWQQDMLAYYGGEELDWFVATIADSFSRVATELSGKGYERLKGILFALFDLLLAPILVFFVLYYKEELKEILLKIAPSAYREEMIAIGHRINRTLERFLLAMLLDCVLVGILCAAALALLGIEFPLLNGLLAGFSTLVPFAGAALSVIPPALIGYAKSGDILIIPKVCALYFLINVVIEGNVIKPLVMRGTLRLNPLAVIFSVMALGEIMGFWGIVLAIPLVAFVKTCAGEVRELVTGADG
jgi:predicted PurR-regulated permease PerM